MLVLARAALLVRVSFHFVPGHSGGNVQVTFALLNGELTFVMRRSFGTTTAAAVCFEANVLWRKVQEFFLAIFGRRTDISCVSWRTSDQPVLLRNETMQKVYGCRERISSPRRIPIISALAIISTYNCG